MPRFVGIDVGAETLKLAETVETAEGLSLGRTAVLDHGKDPGAGLAAALEGWEWSGVAGAAVTGRLSRAVRIPQVPGRIALAEGVRFLLGRGATTVVSIGSRGFSVLELPERGEPRFRESARCAQGTGNFLRQLVGRFGLSVDEAVRRAAAADRAAPLSGRCPVILKTDMTHLANGGERQDRILAGLLDAIAESAEALVKPRSCPPLVVLCGGVVRAERVRRHFRSFLEARRMTLAELHPERALLLEAVGCAVHASRMCEAPPPLEALIGPAPQATVGLLPPLASALARVRRLAAAPAAPVADADLVLGIDVGSTGSKAVALDLARRAPVWEGYLETRGDPVGAAQALVRGFLGSAAAGRVRSIGATGSGREIVGSLLATCFGAGAVTVLNEIAAHARGAVHHDPRVDTVFEIGGQDAKYIRLDHGRVVDAAMNEACSAGTGSFIEEQGRRFAGLDGPEAIAACALSAGASAALGQHCSVFMAEVVDEAIGAGLGRPEIVAGLHESVIANYLNRVKGSRSVGEVVFCQGMPFASDALAAAVARQTGAEVIVPPSPGAVGALGIALLAADAVGANAGPPLELARFLAARVEAKDTFVCSSTRGCGGPGNRCRIDRLATTVEGERRRFTWGGGCALHEGGTRSRKLPDGTPDPFRQRAALVRELAAPLAAGPGRTVAMVDGFQLKGLLPFFATFVHALGERVLVAECGGRAALRRGAEGANVPFCAPMQQFHGAVAGLLEGEADLVLVPRLRELPRVGSERASQLCPIVQASADVLGADLGPPAARRIVAPVFDVGPGDLDSEAFDASCARLARDLGHRSDRRRREAVALAREAQRVFDARLLALGREALEAAARDHLLAVVVLGRTYTIHEEVLSSNVPALLRDQGALAIPLDAYPVPTDAPLFPSMYWGHGQRILRAAWTVRRAAGTYALFASNYSCGPDSFTLHPFGELMQGKPFAVIETDGHAGDAGTKTRIEAFLHCAREHLAGGRDRPARSAERLTVRSRTVADLRRGGERILVPALGPASPVVAAALRGYGLEAEALPEPGSAALALGRRHTSGKECLPLVLTLGSLLERLDRAMPGERFAFFMPGSDGPCRFGAYKELHQLVCDRLGHGDRVTIWSPPFGDYFQGVPGGLGALVLAATAASDAIQDLRDDVRPVERTSGAAGRAAGRWLAVLAGRVEAEARGDLSGGRALREAASGRVYGIPALVREAAEEIAALRGPAGAPLVAVFGEIYVRRVATSNGDLVAALARRGLRVRVAPVTEFLQYSDWASARGRRPGVGQRLDGWVRRRIEVAVHRAAAGPMGWPDLPAIAEVVGAARGLVHEALETETVLTVGAAVRAWRRGEVDGVVTVGPLECMPNKLAETQLVHAGEASGLLTLSLSVNGDPVDLEPLDAFAFEVHRRYRTRERASGRAPRPQVSGPSVQIGRVRDTLDWSPG